MLAKAMESIGVFDFCLDGLTASSSAAINAFKNVLYPPPLLSFREIARSKMCCVGIAPFVRMLSSPDVLLSAESSLESKSKSDLEGNVFPAYVYAVMM